MTYDARAYIRALATAHNLTAEPGDTDGTQLARRAVHTELEDIKRRMQALHDWSAAVIADHAAPRPRATGPTTHAPANRRPSRRPRR